MYKKPIATVRQGRIEHETDSSHFRYHQIGQLTPPAAQGEICRQSSARTSSMKQS